MKKLTTTIILANFIILLAGQIPTTGLVAWYPFNGNANDISGNGHNGTVNGATLTTDRFGNTNSAYNFVATNKNYIQLDNVVGKFGTSDFTLSVWYNAITNGYIICKRNTESYDNFWILLVDKFSISRTTSQTGATDILLNSIPSYNNWHHSVVVKSGTSIKVYIDNILNTNNTLTTDFNCTNNNPLEIGSQVAPVSGVVGCFTGKIDDIRIFNRALSTSEISALYNESICKISTNVTDTLFIKANFTGFNPLTYQNTIKVYPNPTKDAITIDCGSNFSTIGTYKIKISNSLGQAIYQSLITKQTTTINLNSWTGRGIYIIELIDSNNNTIENKKIVLQ